MFAGGLTQACWNDQKMTSLIFLYLALDFVTKQNVKSRFPHFSKIPTLSNPFSCFFIMIQKYESITWVKGMGSWKKNKLAIFYFLGKKKIGPKSENINSDFYWIASKFLHRLIWNMIWLQIPKKVNYFSNKNANICVAPLRLSKRKENI